MKRRSQILIAFVAGSWIFSVPLQTGAQEDAVTICILDSGCNESGVTGKNYLNDSENLEDTQGHGTFVYQILSQSAPDAQLYMLKCFDDSQEMEVEEDNRTVEERIVAAIYEAVDSYHADIINMSWTLNQDSEKLHEAIQYADRHHVLMVAAAGNLSLSTPLGSQVYPAAWEEVIGVAGADTDEQGKPASSLWYLRSEAVFVSADGNCQGEKGSSFATPRISAVLADYLSERPQKTVSLEEAKNYLISLAEDAGEPGYDTVFGWGYINVGSLNHEKEKRR